MEGAAQDHLVVDLARLHMEVVVYAPAVEEASDLPEDLEEAAKVAEVVALAARTAGEGEAAAAASCLDPTSLEMTAW
jgi:hypothetical protein